MARNTLILFFIAITTIGLAQKPDSFEKQPLLSDFEPRWSYGLNMGMIMPSGKTANFYNGSAQNENSAYRVLDNVYFKQQIIEHIGYNYKSYELPGNMGYKPAMSVGFYGRYEFSPSSAFFSQINYHRLTANDVFLLNLDVPGGFSFEPTYLECGIVGKEERTHIDLGYTRSFNVSDKLFFITEIGFNLNNTRVKSNMIGIKNLEYTIKYSGEHPAGPYTTNNTYDILQGGIGYGTFVSGGIRLEFDERISLEPAFSVYWSKINLPPYSAFGANYLFFVRFVMKNQLF